MGDGGNKGAKDLKARRDLLVLKAVKVIHCPVDLAYVEPLVAKGCLVVKVRKVSLEIQDASDRMDHVVPRERLETLVTVG